MAVPFSNTKLRVPRGFRNILEGFSREILRSQPSDIYAFGSLYFEKLLQIRAESGFDPAELGAHEEDRFYNDKAYAKGAARRESSLDEEMAALKIQTKYRQYTAKKVVRGLREEKAAVKIQSVFRGHRDRKRVQSIKDASETIDVARLEMARLEDEEEEEREGDSPSKIIVADFPEEKGIDKSELPKETEEKTEEEEQEEEDEIMSDREDAAVRIQAGMRGLLMRKTLKDQQLIPDAKTESEKQQQDEKELGQKKDEKVEEDEEEEEEEEEEQEQEEEDEIMSDLEDAATIIQAGMRGLLMRKTLKGQQLNPDAQTDEDEKDGQKEDGDKEETGTKEDGDKEESGTKEGGEKEESGTKEGGEKEESATKDASEENDAEKKE